MKAAAWGGAPSKVIWASNWRVERPFAAAAGVGDASAEVARRARVVEMVESFMVDDLGTGCFLWTCEGKIGYGIEKSYRNGLFSVICCGCFEIVKKSL